MQYIIDPNGNIVDSFVGYNKDTTDLENAIDAALGKGDKVN
jgi:hypothetical protein